MVFKPIPLTDKYKKLLEIDVRLVRLHQGLDLADVPKRGRNQIVATKTDYSLSMVARILTGNVPLTMRFITAVSSAFSLNKDWIESNIGPWYVLGNGANQVESNETEPDERFMESVVVREALKELQLMQEPKRWEAVAMLKRMNSEEPTE